MIDQWGQLSYDKQEPTQNITHWIFDADSFVPTAKIKDAKTYSIVSDYLGSPHEMYDEAGKKVWEVVLDIYGRVRTLSGDKSSLPFRYQGQYEDVETGLCYNRFRYYDCESGCFISQDPVSIASGLNVYAYVHDPNTYIDPFGLTGIIYSRIDPYTGKEYVGKSKIPEAFVRRQQAHNSALNKANPGGGQKYDFTELQKDINGKQNLSLAEENQIRDKGGIAKDGGPLENKIHAMTDEKYKDAGGTKNKVKTGCH